MKPPTPEKTYGYHRAGILAAFVNAVLLSVVSLGLLYESFMRLRNPVEVEPGLMLWVSVFALLVNGGITLAVHRGRRDLNVRSVWIHNLGDALSNVAIVVGALAIRYTGASWVDPLIGFAIGGLVLWSGIGILRKARTSCSKDCRAILSWRPWRGRYCAWKASRKFTIFTSGRSAPTSMRSPATYAFPICTWKNAKRF